MMRGSLTKPSAFIYLFHFDFFTRQTLLTNLTNQISETVLPFLPRASPNFEDCQPAGWVSVVFIPPLTMLRHHFFHIRGFQHHLPPSTNTSLWRSFQHLPLQVLVAHTPRSTTLWGNQTAPWGCSNTSGGNQTKPSDLYLFILNTKSLSICKDLLKSHAGSKT